MSTENDRFNHTMRVRQYVDGELPVVLRFDHNEWRRRLLHATLLAGAQFTLAFFMAVVALAKIVEQGFYVYICHFTNWSWTFQFLFYFLTLPAPFVLLGLVDRRALAARVMFAVFFIGYFGLNGIVWTVMTVVTVLLGTKSPFLRNIFEIYPPEIVIIGNDFFHAYPVLALLIFTIVYNKLLFYSLNRVIALNAILDNPTRFSLVIFYQAYFASAIPLAVYTVIFDPQIVYSTNLPVVYGISLAFLCFTAFNLVPLILIFAFKGVASRDAYSIIWLVRNDADPSALPLRSREPMLESGKVV